MKTVLALLVVVNLAAFVFMQTLPKADDILAKVLVEDAQSNLDALGLQVEAGKSYQRLYGKHAFATRMAVGLLAVNGAVFLLQVVLLTARKQRKISQSDMETGTEGDAADSAR